MTETPPMKLMSWPITVSISLPRRPMDRVNAYAKSNGKDHPIIDLSHLLAENNAEKIGGSDHCVNREVVI